MNITFNKDTTMNLIDLMNRIDLMYWMNIGEYIKKKDKEITDHKSKINALIKDKGDSL